MSELESQSTAEAPKTPAETYADGAIVVVKRSSGEIDTGWKVVQQGIEVASRDGSEPKPGVIVQKEVDGEIFEKRVSFEGLDEAFHQKVAEDIGDEALELTGVEEVDDSIDENAHQYGPDQMHEIRGAAAAARRVGDLENAPDPARDILNSVGPEDRMLLKSYAMAVADRKELFDAAHRGEEVTPGATQEVAQSAQWALNQLSPQARAIAPRFAQVYKPTE